jgi:DNA-binding GntR family transcriptional regulator
MIVRDIVQGLYEGRYLSGQRLVEADLTRRYGVSRGSVREALSRLAADGIVTLERHRGACIRSVDREHAFETLVLVEVLTGLAARLAAERIALPGAADSLRAALEGVLRGEPRGSVLEYGLARRDFFDVLVKIGGNRELGRLKAGLQLSLVGMMARVYENTIDAAREDDFREIAEAIFAGAAAAADAAARRHVRRVSEALIAIPANAFGGLPEPKTPGSHAAKTTALIAK